MKQFLGIEIGGTKLQLVLGDDRGAIQRRCRLTVQPARGAAGIREAIQTHLPELLQDASPAAVGVGFGGPVDAQTGQVCCSHQIAGWEDFPLRAWLEELTRRPAAVENDANVAALGEAHHGAGQGYDPVFYVTLGSGVGGGLVVGGRIYHGAKPGEAEIGHVRLDRRGVVVEQRCSGWAVDARIRRLKDEGVASVLTERIGPTPGGEARHLRAALDQHDAAAQRILQDTAADLAFALSHVVHLLHPAAVVLGGGLALVGEPLRAAVAEALSGWVMKAFAPGPPILLSRLREDAVPVGCLRLAGQRL